MHPHISKPSFSSGQEVSVARRDLAELAVLGQALTLAVVGTKWWAEDLA